jgi:hypothetical protein
VVLRQGFGVTGRQEGCVDAFIGVDGENPNLEARNPKQIRMKEWEK